MLLAAREPASGY